ncbi:hypothetical protein E2562_019356 [Oryza meyeriana var. granulata]|uniref:Uncharacterized protein n=1 Tax=Oryza meyeriana var. granulata TaxID=110450 RepID=A0A6G1BKI2_9ORYZ|nr:hypothetical protein E2562_019356 [Oryza meyeriana var. granulata]
MRATTTYRGIRAPPDLDILHPPACDVGFPLLLHPLWGITSSGRHHSQIESDASKDGRKKMASVAWPQNLEANRGRNLPVDIHCCSLHSSVCLHDGLVPHVQALSTLPVIAEGCVQREALKRCCCTQQCGS